MTTAGRCSGSTCPASNGSRRAKRDELRQQWIGLRHVDVHPGAATCPARRNPVSTLLPMARLGSSAAVAGVMTICPAPAIFSAMIVAVAAGPAINQLPVRITHHEEVERAGVDPYRHPQPDLARRGPEHTDIAQGVTHLVGRGACPLGVSLPPEEEEQGVATKLDQGGAEGICLGEQPLEGAADDLGDFLGAHLPVPGQPLRHRGEPGDIHHDHRPLDGPVQGPGSNIVPLPDEPREVGVQRGGRHAQSLERKRPRSRLLPPQMPSLTARLSRVRRVGAPALRRCCTSAVRRPPSAVAVGSPIPSARCLSK